jgi:PIN domain nuclease of toxin-antitoxin system
MTVLLDTHALLWWLFDDPKLSAGARAVIKDPDNVILASSASAWEMATKYRLGKLPEAGEAVHNLLDLLRLARIDALPISIEHALAAGLLPGPHRDPFDRMLIVQAQLEQVPIVTLDPEIKKYDVKIVW